MYIITCWYQKKYLTIDDISGDGENISQPNDCFFIVPSFIDHIQSGGNPIFDIEKLHKITVLIKLSNSFQLYNFITYQQVSIQMQFEITSNHI